MRTGPHPPDYRANQWLTEENLDSSRKLTTLASELGWAPEQLALAWLLS